MVYTLLVFMIGVFATGAYLTIREEGVSWISKGQIDPVISSGTQEQSPTETVIGSSTSNNLSVGQNTNVNMSLVESNIIEKIVDLTGPAVVKIETVIKTTSSNPFFNDPFFREFFGGGEGSEPQERVQEGMGSGFIISKDGYILTNNHVIDGASEVRVFLSDNNEPYQAKLIGSDAELDLAILKIDTNKELPMLSLGDSNKVRAGNWVIAIGNPYGLDHTVTVGVISATGRPITVQGTEFKDLIQTDASINPGNSGGPLLNLSGEVVGINTAINSNAQGIGFAIPASTVKQVLDQLLEEGKVIRPWLGVYMQPVTEELAEYFGLDKTDGALIGAVQEGSPAEKAGIIRGDIILEYNKQKIATPDELQAAVKGSVPGDSVVILIYRNEATMYITVKIGER